MGASGSFPTGTSGRAPSPRPVNVPRNRPRACSRACDCAGARARTVGAGRAQRAHRASEGWPVSGSAHAKQRASEWACCSLTPWGSWVRHCIMPYDRFIDTWWCIENKIWADMGEAIMPFERLSHDPFCKSFGRCENNVRTRTIHCGGELQLLLRELRQDRGTRWRPHRISLPACSPRWHRTQVALRARSRSLLESYFGDDVFDGMQRRQQPSVPSPRDFFTRRRAVHTVRSICTTHGESSRTAFDSVRHALSTLGLAI